MASIPVIIPAIAGHRRPCLIGQTPGQIVHRVTPGKSPAGADLDAGDDAAGFRPRPGSVEESLEPAQLLAGRRRAATNRPLL